MAQRSAARAEFLHDILIGFVEDGCTNTWRSIDAWHYDEADPSQAWAVFIEDDDDLGADAPKHRVTIETIARGLSALQAGDVHMGARMLGSILAADAENDAGDIDAYDADAIVQAGVFGNLVYG